MKRGVPDAKTRKKGNEGNQSKEVKYLQCTYMHTYLFNTPSTAAMKKTQPALDASSCDYDGPKYSADQKQFARKAEGVKTKDSLSEWRLSYYYKTLETMTPPAKKDTNQN